MTEQEEARITAAARRAAAQLPPMTPETARKIAAIITAAEAEKQAREDAGKPDAA